MADRETPGAPAPDEGERAPDDGSVGGFVGRVLPAVTAHAAAPTAAPTVVAAPEPASDAPRLAFERWAFERFGVVFNERSRASGVKAGKRIKGGTRSAALINAARARHKIPVGKTMTEAEFNQLIDATKSIEVR